MSVSRRSPRTAPAIALGLALVVAGCDQPTGTTRRAKAPPEPVVERPAPPVEPEAKPRPILGEKTRDVRDATKEVKAGGVVTAPGVASNHPIPVVGNPYVSIIGRAAILNIEHAVDLYKAETGEFPKTYEEFKEKILDANNIALPKLPFYQEYGYDAPNHKLVIMEYPDRKAKANYPR